MKIVGIIPARYGSTRYPGKPLALILGKPLIEWVWNNAKKVKIFSDLIIATDDKRIIENVEKFGGKAVLTSKKWRSGSERCTEIARQIHSDLIVNIQGDEPLISPRTIKQVIDAARKEKTASLVTAAVKTNNREEYLDKNTVKVVCDQKGYALYFSRAPIPYPRGGVIEHYFCYKHLGIYVYPKDFLLKFITLTPTLLERIENLEQLRVLEHGYKIKVVLVKENSYSIDTPADLQKVEKILEDSRKK